MSEHGEQKITLERLRGLGLVPPGNSPSHKKVKLERVTHLFVVREFEAGKPPYVHLVTESGAFDLDALLEVTSLTGRPMGFCSAERYRRPLNELSWYACWRILHRDFRGLDDGVQPEEFKQLRKCSGTCGLSLNELAALRKIHDRFRGRGNKVEELLHEDHGPDGEGEIGVHFGPRCRWLRPKTRRPVTIGELDLAVSLAILRALRKLRLRVGLRIWEIEDCLRHEVVIASMVLPATPTEADK